MLRDRTLTVLMLVALVAAGWFAGRWTLMTPVASAVQLEPVQAAIHPGTCAEPEPEPAHALEAFDRESGPGESTAPLSSFSELPIGLDNLLESPHAVLVTVGGDLGATLACGEIEDVSGGVILAIELVAQNGSGVSGLGLILDDGTVTRVSVILDEGAGAPPVPATSPVAQATPITSSPTPASSAVEPSATERSGFPIPLPSAVAETPEPPPTVATVEGDPMPTAPGTDVAPTPASGVIPSIPIGLPPIAQGTTPEPSAVAGGEATEYASQEFGYSISIPAGWSFRVAPQAEPGFDQIVLTNGVSTVTVSGFGDTTDAATCVDENYEFLRQQAKTVLIVPHEGPDAALATRGPQRTVEIWDMVILDTQNENLPLTYYNECRALGTGQGVLLLTHEAPRDVYLAQAVERDRLFSSLVMP